MKIESIKQVYVHWSESGLINDALGCDENCDINKWISPAKADDLIIDAAKQVNSGYDKIVLTIDFHGEIPSGDWQYNKFCITKSTKGLLDLIKQN